MSLTDNDIQDILSNLSDEQQKALFEQLNRKFNEPLLQPKPRRKAKSDSEKVYCCIHCGSADYKGNGYTTKGKKRYRCNDCGKSWSENYGDSLRYTHLSEDVWKEMLRGFVEELSPPKIAKNCNTLWYPIQRYMC